MSPSPKRWDVAPQVPARQRNRLSHLHPLIVQILYNRGVTDPQEVDAFLNGRGYFHDPFRMRGMAEAVKRIRDAIRTRQLITIYGDFDADGVCATALLAQTLSALGARVTPYIPHRVDEGYGLNCDALDRIASCGTELVITVDCGIRSLLEVSYAGRLGMDMILTDHHSLGPELPSALAVINPKQPADPYPFKELAGVGIAFKLAQALLLAEHREPLGARPIALRETDLLDLVALGTVADIAPLLGENRALVQRGLAELNRARRLGVQALLAEAGLPPGRIDATAIGFILGPRINAAGRLSTAELSYKLLMAQDEVQALTLAGQLGHLNRERQTLTLQKLEVARQHIAARQRGPLGEPLAPGSTALSRYLYLVADPEFPPGIVGLVAGRLAEEMYRPALVAQLGPEETHGSARSIPEFNITAALDECRDLLLRHGGHAAAAGFTVSNQNLPALESRLEQIATRELAGQDLQPTLQIDAIVSLDELDFAVYELLQQLEPCGCGNPQPVLATLGLYLISAQRVGADSKHLKLKVRDPQSSQEWEAIAFRQAEWFGNLPHRIDLAYSLEVNEFNGERRLQLNVKDIRPAG